VERQTTGIDCGGFTLVYYRHSNARIDYDGRETSPFGTDAFLFLQMALLLL